MRRIQRLSTRRNLILLLLLAEASTRASAQDPLTTHPDNCSLAFQNEAVAVVRAHYGPHAHLGVHDRSPAPTIYVYRSDSGPVRFEYQEEHALCPDQAAP